MSASLCASVCVCICLPVRTRVFVCVCAYLCVYVCLCECISLYLYISTCLCECACVCVCIRVRIYAYTIILLFAPNSAHQRNNRHGREFRKFQFPAPRRRDRRRLSFPEWSVDFGMEWKSILLISDIWKTVRLSTIGIIMEYRKCDISSQDF